MNRVSLAWESNHRTKQGWAESCDSVPQPQDAGKDPRSIQSTTQASSLLWNRHITATEGTCSIWGQSHSPGLWSHDTHWIPALALSFLICKRSHHPLLISSTFWATKPKCYLVNNEVETIHAHSSHGIIEKKFLIVHSFFFKKKKKWTSLKQVTARSYICLGVKTQSFRCHNYFRPFASHTSIPTYVSTQWKKWKFLHGQELDLKVMYPIYPWETF